MHSERGKARAGPKRDAAGAQHEGMDEMRRARLLQAMREVDGVARVARLGERCVSRYDIETAVAERMISRVRVGWVALPDADPLRLLAARHGAVLTCVTQARRLGIWVHDQNPRLHLAATPGSRGGKPREACVHWAKPLVPRHPDALEDPIENVLSLVATCEPYEQALATWESALNKGLVDRERLTSLRWGPAGRRLLGEAIPFADAGLETYLRLRLRWLRLPLYSQTWIAGHRVDALIGERLVLQIDGGTHVGAQRDADNRHDAELKLRGYHVIRIGYHQMMREWPVVQDLIMRAIAQGLAHARTA